MKPINLKFYLPQLERVLARKKTTMLLAELGRIDVEKKVNISDEAGNKMASATILRIDAVKITSEKFNHFIGDPDRTKFVLKSENMDEKLLIEFVKETYGIPFLGYCIYFKLDN
jgi:hypothetical protein